MNGDWMIPVVRHVVAPLWAAWERSPYLRHYRSLRRTQFDAPTVIRDRQWQAVAALLRHAYETTPFYRRRFDAAGFAPPGHPLVRRLRGRAGPDQAGPANLGIGDDLVAVRRGDAAAQEDLGLDRRLARGRWWTSRPCSSSAADAAVRRMERLAVRRAGRRWSGATPSTSSTAGAAGSATRCCERAVYLDTLKMDEAAMARFADRSAAKSRR